MRTSRAVAIIPVLFFAFMARAEEEARPAAPVPNPTTSASPEIKVDVPKKDFVVPTLPEKPPGIWNGSPTPTDNTNAVLARLQRAANEARMLEVWSLDPSIDSTKEKPIKSRLYPFHDNYAIGREELKGDKEIQKLLLAVARSIAKGTDMPNLCFDPRHGLRIYGPKGFIDVVICYECLQGVIYEGKEETWFYTSADAEADFDAVFAQLGLKKAL